MAEGDSIQKGVGAVPEFYYDLISRVVPGGLFILVGALTFGTQPQFEAFAKAAHELQGLGFATVFLVVFAAGGYFAGMLLTPLGWVLALPTRTPVWYASRKKYADLIGYLRSILGESTSATSIGYWEYDRLDRQMHDILKDRNSQAKIFLPKLRAEAGLCHNAAGAVLLWLALEFGFTCTISSAIGPASIIFGLSIFAAFFREYRLMRRQFVYLDLLKKNALSK